MIGIIGAMDEEVEQIVAVMDIKKEDPEAFINYFGSKGVRGNFYYQEED